jgi:hypothetical protein
VQHDRSLRNPFCSKHIATSESNAAFFVFFDQQGNMHHEFAPENQTINQDLYLAVLRCLRDAVRRKRPEMWTA